MKKVIFSFILFFSIFCIVNAETENSNTIIQEEVYYKIDTFYDSLGNVLLENEIEITEDEYENLETILSTAEKCYIGNACVQTNMKRLSLTISGNKENCKIELKLHYFNMPQYRSYDVIALRWNGFEINNFNGLQKGKINGINEKVNYYENSNNVKKSSNGVGISMNLYDDATELDLSLSANGKITGSSIDIFGTYQHAQGNLSLSDSKSYSFSQNGLGEVLYYSNSNIRNMYDKMDGVKVVGFKF